MDEAQPTPLQDDQIDDAVGGMKVKLPSKPPSSPPPPSTPVPGGAPVPIPYPII